MPDIQRITTEYLDSEDRLRITGEIAPRQAVVMWLTQRLLQRLISHLCGSLDSRAADQSPNRSMHSDVMQSFAQQAARAQLSSQAPVLASSTSRQWLVVSVDITPTQGHIALTFKGLESDAQATLSLHEQALRQWLSILLEQCGRAGWRIDMWPDWMLEQRQHHTSSAVLMH